MIVRRAWVANAILLASAVIVTTVAIEFVFRRLPGERFILTRSTLCSPEYPAQRSDYLPFTTPRSATVHAKRAEFSVDYIFDHNGYRTSAQPVPVPETADSIIFVGDSFTLGWGVDYDRTFPGILAREFGEKISESIMLATRLAIPPTLTPPPWRPRARPYDLAPW